MSKVEMSAYERFAEPQEVDVLSIVPNKKELGRLFKKDAKAIADALEAMSECELWLWLLWRWWCGAGWGGVGLCGMRAVMPYGRWGHHSAFLARRLSVPANHPSLSCPPPAPRPAGDALEMAGKLAVGQAAGIKADGQAFEMQPGFVEIKKQRKKMSGRWGPGVGWLRWVAGWRTGCAGGHGSQPHVL